MLHDGTVTTHANTPGILHLLRSWTAILIHNDGILFLRIEVLGFYHPGNELLMRCGENDKCFLAHIIGGILRLQFLVVDERGERLALIVAERIDGRIVDVAPSQDKVFEIFREDSTIPAFIWCQAVGLAVTMVHIDLLVHRVVQGSKINVTRRLIVAVDVSDDGMGILTEACSGLLQVAHGAHQLTVEVVEVDVVIAVALAGQHDVFVSDAQLC